MIRVKRSSNIGLIILCCLAILFTTVTILIKPYTYNEDGRLSDNNEINNSTTSLNTSYLSISNVSVTSNSLYTVCSGTISVKSYSPYKYHYIKVKAAFKTSYGSTVDTDWTYAIGSEWLEPGESSKFRLSVDKDYTIDDCSVSIMTN